jgi:hypothetical protein
MVSETLVPSSSISSSVSSQIAPLKNVDADFAPTNSDGLDPHTLLQVGTGGIVRIFRL